MKWYLYCDGTEHCLTDEKVNKSVLDNIKNVYLAVPGLSCSRQDLLVAAGGI